jgi:hypothetical protein
MNADEFTALVRRRVESRYRRMVFVHRELAKLSEKGKKGGGGEEPRGFGESFDDFVFRTIDFSIYKKIEAGEFILLFDDGLEDFEENYYQTAFGSSREDVRRTILRSYIRVGPFYVCKQASPLVLSIMRSVHTSLDFAPLFVPADINENGAEQYPVLVAALDGVVICHDDDMETRLFVPRKKNGMDTAALYGTFHPLGKAHTIVLIGKAAFGGT